MSDQTFLEESHKTIWSFRPLQRLRVVPLQGYHDGQENRHQSDQSTAHKQTPGLVITGRLLTWRTSHT